MAIKREKVREYLQDFNFKTLFIEEMGWSVASPARPVPMTIDGTQYIRTPIAQMSGVMVYEIAPVDTKSEKIPDSKIRAAIHKEIEGLSHENLLIFLDNGKQRTQSLWYWVKRDGKKKSPREHLYLKGQPGDLFLSKLDSMVIELDELREDGTIAITKVTEKLATSLDVERVTKKFYGEFSSLRVEFINLIEGIDHEADRFWYASVLLNRLMFVYFLQEKGFIQNNTRYLEDKLQASKTRGADLFYSEFLQALFFEGFAKPETQRSPQARTLLGNIKYLNGGLFLPHRLELDYPNIRIADQAFENVLALFGRYSWHLDDTPGANDDEINPDVLGYIFEKYINQKAFGAYYTRTEITQYLCERTINAVIVEKINQVSQRQFHDIGDLLIRLDADLCRKLLNILPTLSILDPACGSGAFLVAAMKTLLNIYAAVFGKIDFFNDTNLTQHKKEVLAQHPSLNYYIRKTIITDNLYGVDIMEEATEIAKLRLFLFLVSSAQRVEQLEPLPNIDFNILCGNSLIGLLNVDGKRFDSRTKTQDMFQGQKAAQYQDLLKQKNDLIQRYKGTASITGDLVDLRRLRDDIDDAKKDAYQTLNEILLDDFAALGIKYEQAQTNGKATKRPLEIGDMERLEPFHWGYEFDEIMGTRGGFDIIITNPPWEIFKPDTKEFFAKYSDVVTKKKMNLKDFEKEQAKLMQDFEVAEAWLEFQSQYRHVNTFFRSAPQFRNQTSVIDGKKSGADLNLYKLFTEQCYNLLRESGQCGIVIPSGIHSDLGAKQLREMLFNNVTITGLFGFENRKMIFEGVDSRFKFVVLTFEKGGRTVEFPVAFMRHDVIELETFPNDNSIIYSVQLAYKLSPDSLSLVEFSTGIDIEIAQKILRFNLLGEALSDTWNIKFYREFHMTDDAYLFHEEYKPGRLILYEGKVIHQFTHIFGKPRYWVDEKEGRKALLGRKKDVGQKLDYQTYRLGFRDIASNTNERTLISTIIPPAFHGNKLPAVMVFDDGKSLIDNPTQLFACAIFNSFTVDYLIRQRVTTTINYHYLYQLPIPRFILGNQYFDQLVEHAAKLICTTPEFDDLAAELGFGSHKNGVTNGVERARLRAEIDGMVAHIYGLTEAEFAHILSTFPLVDQAVKDAALAAFREVERGLVK